MVLNAEPYQVKVTFAYDAPLTMPLNGQRNIPFGAPVQKRPGIGLLNVRESGRVDPFQCFAGRQIEEINLTFAEGLPLPVSVTGRTIENATFSYSSRYRLEGRTLTVRREFESHVNGQVCAPEIEAAIAQDIKLMQGSMSTKLTFKPPTERTAEAKEKIGSVNSAPKGSVD